MNRVLATAIDNWFQFDSGSWSRARRHSKIQCRKNFVQGRYNSNEEMRKIWRSTVFFFWEARYAGRDKDERALHKFVSAVQGSWTLLNITEGLWMRPWECSSWIFVTGQHPTLSRPRLARFRPVHKKKVKAKLFFFSPPSLIVYIYRVEREGKLNAPIRMIPRFWRHTCALAFFFFISFATKIIITTPRWLGEYNRSRNVVILPSIDLPVSFVFKVAHHCARLRLRSRSNVKRVAGRVQQSCSSLKKNLLKMLKKNLNEVISHRRFARVKAT